MTGDFIFRLILGHLVGDYVLQNHWMALNKKEEWLPCIVHCLVYTGAVCLFTAPELFAWKWHIFVPAIVLIFLSHFVLDRTNIIDKYLDLIGGRSWGRSEDIDNRQYSNFMTSVVASYTSIVQTGVDNTVHLILMYFIFKYCK